MLSNDASVESGDESAGELRAPQSHQITAVWSQYRTTVLLRYYKLSPGFGELVDRAEIPHQMKS